MTPTPTTPEPDVPMTPETREAFAELDRRIVADLGGEYVEEEAA